MKTAGNRGVSHIYLTTNKYVSTMKTFLNLYNNQIKAVPRVPTYKIQSARYFLNLFIVLKFNVC